MVKPIRHKKIIEIIRSRQVETQYQLARELKEAGFDVTQATVSRDIKELGLVKVPGENNNSHYTLPDRAPDLNWEDRLKRLLISSVQGLDCSENLVVVKTLPGEAQGVASAIDQAKMPNIIGTVAGDDTILVVVKPKSAVSEVIGRFRKLTGG
ncbi:MAG: arginine repressor [Peptococcaceae bacterium]|nr:arginine repressor [Peptococcaceae bacterium]